MNQIVNGLKEGYWKWYHYNGNLWYKGNYISDKRDGYWEVYHSNLCYKCNYISGRREGYWELYNSDGKLEKQDIFI